MSSKFTYPHNHPQILQDQNEGYMVCATALIRSRASDKVILILNEKMDKINFPGGKMEGGDNLQDTVYKEVLQEVGITQDQLTPLQPRISEKGISFTSCNAEDQVYIRHKNPQFKVVDYLGIFEVGEDIDLIFREEITQGQWSEVSEEDLCAIAGEYFPEKKVEDCFFKENLEILKRLR